MIVMEDRKTSNKIGKFLKRYRTEEKDMNLRDFADLIGVSFSHLSKIERGEHHPSKTTVGMIADSLNLDKDKLFLMAGYVNDGNSSALDTLFPWEEDEESKKKDEIINKIITEFPDADLMFNDLASFTADDMEEVYDYIKYIKSKKNKRRGD